MMRCNFFIYRLYVLILFAALSFCSCLQAKYPAASFKPAVRSSPDEVDMCYNLGIAHSILRQNQQAAEEFQSVVTHRPDDADAQFRLGILLYDLKKTDESVKALTRALQEKKFNTSHTKLAIAYKILQRFAEAEEQFRLAYDSDEPHPIYILVNWGNTLNNLKRTDEAVHIYLRALQHNPEFAAENYNIFYLLGISYHLLDRYKDAVEALQLAIKYNPDFADSYYNLALIHYEHENYEAAEELYVFLKKKNSDSAVRLGEILHKK